jgi:predicted acetyltransferase
LAGKGSIDGKVFQTNICFSRKKYKLHKELIKYNYSVSCGQGALPDPSIKRRVSKNGFSLRIFERNEIAGLYANESDNKNWHMVGQSEETEIIVAGYDNNMIVGLAIADKQTDTLYDIGYEVLPEYRNKGIATAITMELTNLLLIRSIIPFATFAWSNIASKKVLYNCGYYPAWSSMGSADMEWAIKVMNGEAE